MDPDAEEFDALELPTPELRDAAFQLFGETTASRRDKLRETRQRIEALPPRDRLDDLSGKSLIRFLRGRKFDVDRAVTSAVNMAHFMREHPDWFARLQHEDFSDLSAWIQLLPQRDREGRVILILRLSHGIRETNVDVLKTHPLKLVRWNMYFLTHLTYNLYVQVHGLVVINAFGSLEQADSVKLRSIVNVQERIAVFRFIAGCCPFRLGGIYVFDEPAIFRWLWSVVYVFLSAKLKKRFHICGKNYDAIREVIPDVSFLPSCLGGSLEDEDFDWQLSHERFKLEIF